MYQLRPNGLSILFVSLVLLNLTRKAVDSLYVDFAACLSILLWTWTRRGTKIRPDGFNKERRLSIVAGLLLGVFEVWDRFAPREHYLWAKVCYTHQCIKRTSLTAPGSWTVSCHIQQHISQLDPVSSWSTE